MENPSIIPKMPDKSKQQYYLEHREEILEKRKKYYLNNQNKIKRYKQIPKVKHKALLRARTFRKERPEYSKEYEQNPEIKLRRHLRFISWRDKTRDLVFSHYCKDGDIKCAGCGIKDMRVLSLDHINGGGNKHRREIVNEGYTSNTYGMYRWIIDTVRKNE